MIVGWRRWLAGGRRQAARDGSGRGKCPPFVGWVRDGLLRAGQLFVEIAADGGEYWRRCIGGMPFKIGVRGVVMVREEAERDGATRDAERKSG